MKQTLALCASYAVLLGVIGHPALFSLVPILSLWCLDVILKEHCA